VLAVPLIRAYFFDADICRIMMRPPLGTVEKYTFRSTGMGRTTGGRTGSADPTLQVAGSGGNGMMGMNMRSLSSEEVEQENGKDKKEKRQMGGMMSMKDAGWTHAMHVHLVVSHDEIGLIRTRINYRTRI
jgi:hypothetical protein